MTRQEVIDKATDLMAPILGRENTRKIVESVYRLEQVADIRAWSALLHPV